MNEAVIWGSEYGVPYKVTTDLTWADFRLIGNYEPAVPCSDRNFKYRVSVYETYSQKIYCAHDCVHSCLVSLVLLIVTPIIHAIGMIAKTVHLVGKTLSGRATRMDLWRLLFLPLLLPSLMLSLLYMQVRPQDGGRLYANIERFFYDDFFAIDWCLQSRPVQIQFPLVVVCRFPEAACHPDEERVITAIRDGKALKRSFRVFVEEALILEKVPIAYAVDRNGAILVS